MFSAQLTDILSNKVRNFLVFRDQISVLPFLLADGATKVLNHCSRTLPNNRIFTTILRLGARSFRLVVWKII